MRYWLNTLPTRYGRIERFNHTYPRRHTESRGRTLDIGAGLGGHMEYEGLSSQEYHAVELREELVDALRSRFPTVHAVVADCQERLPFQDAFFDRVLAIHVLEHLPDLPRALDEIQRVLKPDGRLVVVIPCEGGLAYSLGRRLTVQRLFERRYGVSYKWHIESDHLNVPAEILEELGKRFDVVDRTYFPLRVPSVHLNLTIGLTLANDASRGQASAAPS